MPLIRVLNLDIVGQQESKLKSRPIRIQIPKLVKNAVTPSPRCGDILKCVVIGLSRRSDEPLRAAAIRSAVSCGFSGNLCVSADNGPVCARPSAERMANLQPLPPVVPQRSIRQRSRQMELPADGDLKECRKETFEKRSRKALSETSGPRPVDIGTESAFTIDKRRHSGLESVGEVI